ncbi:beta-lactamase/transpeptidase-like protein [Flammula alnicola]|nr:beta-lactamase/transpeptidase-like protein [Flammula alnicola]
MSNECAEPTSSSNDHIVKASKDLDKYLSSRASKSDIDSIAVAVVTPAGSIFEAGYGVLKANETDAEHAQPVDRDSIYRIASISKMFTVLETLILRERGVLNWDDPADKYLPEFTPPSSSYGWARYLDGQNQLVDSDRPRITLRQLASHLAGIGRDYPPRDIGEWPIPNPAAKSLLPDQNRTYDEIMKAVSQYPLVNVPYEYPIYSNTGIDVLGLANIAANQISSVDPSREPGTHKELVKRDIFDPLGLNSSFFRVPAADATLRGHIAVPSKDAEWADVSLGDMGDAAGGQYSSLGDLAKLMKTLLSPTARTASSRRVLCASGNLPGYRSEFALVPEYSVGIIVLVTGTYADTGTILKEAAKRVIPALEKLHQDELQRRYVGTWINGEDVAEVVLSKGALTLKKLVVRGVDVLKLVQTWGSDLAQSNGSPVALWSTGRIGEFRLAFGRPELNNVRDIGCWPYWITIDPGVNSRGSPVDLIYWKNGVLTYPSSGVSFSRKRH